MKRDMELVRKILFEVEKMDACKNGIGEVLGVEGYSQEVISYHLKIMAQANLVEARVSRLVGEASWRVRDLTWDGQEFLENSRSNTRWSKAMRMAKEKADTLSFETLKLILKVLVDESLEVMASGA
ncbi:MAG: DUF2513 domain-containing protein [bacterium]|nr:DUF2513 domain-containing protein [bacterium]